MTRAAVAVLLLTGTLASSAVAQCPEGTPPPCHGAAAPPRTPAPAANSIAVLPFANRSPDSADAFLAEALPEQIQGRLSGVSGLQPKSQAVVNAQWRRTPDPMEAARTLRIAWFITGTVRRSGRAMMVSVELVRASTGDGAWSATFRRTDDDIAAVEEAIAESVAVAIVGRLAPAQAFVLRRTPTRSTEAYRLYLYAATLIKRRTEADTRAALVALGEAVRLDSTYAAAWGRIGVARVQQASYGFERGRSRDSLYALAGVAVARALGLDSSNADARVALGYAAVRHGDFDRARVAFERVLRTDSLSADGASFQGVLYGPLIGLAESRLGTLWFRRAAALDPTDRNVWRNLGYLAMGEPRLEDAERLADSSLAFGPWAQALALRADVRFARGNGVGALADVAEAERLDSVPRNDSRALYTILLGDSAPARGVLARLRTQADSGQVVYAALARFSMALGQRSEALAAIERLRATPDSLEPRCSPTAPCSASLRTWRLLHDPIFAPLHGDPRFERLWEETRPRVPWLEGQGR